MSPKPRVEIKLRPPPEVKLALLERAKANGRTLNAECCRILQRALKESYR